MGQPLSPLAITALKQKLSLALPPQAAKAFDALVETYKEVVADVEHSGRIATTKDHYGSYLAFMKKPSDVVALLLAGANAEGVLAAASLNGVHLSGLDLQTERMLGVVG